MAGPAIDAGSGAGDAGAADGGTLDAGPLDAAAPPPAELSPTSLCERVCDRVIVCMRKLVGSDLPPSVDEERMRNEVRDECLDECTEEIDEHVRDARACLDEEDCKDFLDCIKALDDD